MKPKGWKLDQAYWSCTLCNGVAPGPQWCPECHHPVVRHLVYRAPEPKPAPVPPPPAGLEQLWAEAPFPETPPLTDDDVPSGATKSRRSRQAAA